MEYGKFCFDDVIVVFYWCIGCFVFVIMLGC